MNIREAYAPKGMRKDANTKAYGENDDDSQCVVNGDHGDLLCRRKVDEYCLKRITHALKG